jgi:hypothetical protein
MLRLGSEHSFKDIPKPPNVSAAWSDGRAIRLFHSAVRDRNSWENSGIGGRDMDDARLLEWIRTQDRRIRDGPV